MNKFEFVNPSLFKGVSAEKAVEELERIKEKHGELQPEFVVDESRDKDAVLHCCFQWDDTKAAELYRKEQARKLIGNIIVTVEEENVTIKVRNFVNVRIEDNGGRTYIPTREVFNNDVSYNDLLSQAKEDAARFVRKYHQIEEANNAKASLLAFINGIQQ